MTVLLASIWLFRVGWHIEFGIHALMKDTGDDDPNVAVVQIATQVVGDVRCSATAMCRELHVKGTNACSQLWPVARTRSLRILRDQFRGSVYQLGVEVPLTRTEPSRTLSQNALDIFISCLGKPIAVSGRHTLPAHRVPELVSRSATAISAADLAENRRVRT